MELQNMLMSQRRAERNNRTPPLSKAAEKLAKNAEPYAVISFFVVFLLFLWSSA